MRRNSRGLPHGAGGGGLRWEKTRRAPLIAPCGVGFLAAHLDQHKSLASTDCAVVPGTRLTMSCERTASAHLLRRWSNSALTGAAEQSDPPTRAPSAVPRQQLSSPFARAPGAAGCPLAHVLPSRGSPGAVGGGEAHEPKRWFKPQQVLEGHNVPSTYSCRDVNRKEQPGQHQNTEHPLQSKRRGRSEMQVKDVTG